MYTVSRKPGIETADAEGYYSPVGDTKGKMDKRMNNKK